MRTRINILTKALFLLMGVSLVALCPQLANAQHRSGSNEVYTGNIFYFGGTRGTITTNFTLKIDSLTPDGEVQQILNDLQRGGQDALMKTISKDKRGTIQIGNGLGHDINAVWVSEDEEGRKITILFERWLNFGELRRGARSVDYPFTYIELFVDDKGKGDGTMIPAARIRYKKGKTIEVENFGIYPAKLTNVKRRG